MKRSPKYYLIALGFVLFAAVAATVAMQSSTGFDTRNQAAMSSTPFVAMRNGERVYAAFSGTGTLPYLFRLKKEGGAAIEEKVVSKDTTGFFRYYSSVLPVTTDNKSYFVEIYACGDNACNTLPGTPAYTSDPATTPLKVSAIAGQIKITDSNYCADQGITLWAQNQTRYWMKYVITNTATGEVVNTSYKDTEFIALCEGPKQKQDLLSGGLIEKAYACTATPTPLEPDNTYFIKMYYCSDMCTMGVEQPISCTPTCNYLMQSQNYTTSSCGVNQVDMSVTNLIAPTQLNELENVSVSVKVKNNSSIPSGSYHLVVGIYSGATALETHSEDLSSLAASAEVTRSFSFLGRTEGSYTIKATVSVLDPITDPVSTNNVVSKTITFVKPVVTCTACPSGKVQKADCSCVDCIGDANCSATKRCDTATNSCVCNNALCSSGKKMNVACTSCVCNATCGPNQWQDTDCACHATACVNNCTDKQILQADCSCKNVECKQDSQCNGLKKCDSVSNSCKCSLLCSTGTKVDATCSACVCSNTCKAGQTLRGDCSCVANETQTPTQTAATLASSSLKITPISNSVLTVGDKAVLSYAIVGNYNFEQAKLKWIVDGRELAGQNSLPFVFDSAGIKTIQLIYDGKVYDTMNVSVLGATSVVTEQSATLEGATTSSGSPTGLIVFVGGIVLAALALSTGVLLITKRRRNH